MKRVWAGVIAGVLVVAAIVAFLLVRDSDDNSEASRKQTSLPSPSVSKPPLPLSTRAGIGLRKLIAAHPLGEKKPSVSLAGCPYRSVRDDGRAVDAASGGSSSKYQVAQAVVQRYKIRVPYDGSVGDRGIAVSCFGTSKDRTILGLSATTNTQPVPEGAIKGLQGPTKFGDGATYAKSNNRDLCSVYWVPPKRDYDLVVVFRTAAKPTPARCRAGFAAAAPIMLDSLAALAG